MDNKGSDSVLADIEKVIRDRVPVADAETVLRKWRSHCPEGIDSRIQILVTRPGYAHCLYEGTCDPTVTLDDLAKLFAHPQFGARGAWIRDGRFSVIRHLD